jgi:hypothetical protein
MPGLVPGIHDFTRKDVKGRDRPGHDRNLLGEQTPLAARAARLGSGSSSTGATPATFALRLLPRELAGAADGLGLLAGALLGGLLVIITELHLAEDAFALHFLLQSPEGLIDIVIANDDLHALRSPIGR